MERTQRVPEEKRRLRERHRRLRRELSPAQRESFSRTICERLLRSDWYAAYEVIYGYYPLEDEVNCLLFLEQALLDGKTVALPRTGAGGDGSMEFYRVNSFDQTEEGRFHVMEPTTDCPLLREPQAAVLVPGLVFDRQGNRYGYGKGYYDRYFERFPGLRRMAAAFENQMEDCIAADETDQRMERIYTEHKVYAEGGQ